MMDKMKEEDVNLIVSAGDQVEDQSWGKSSEYAAFFAPEEMTSLLYAPDVYKRQDKTRLYRGRF